VLRLALLCVSRLSEGYTSFGKLHLWRLDERPSGSFTSGGVLRLSERPSGSFTSGGFPKEANVLREASPLAASFGKLHLWRGGGFPKEAEGSELVLKKARPSGGSRRTCVLPKHGLSERPSGSFTSGGFLRKASPLALSEGSEGSRRTCVLPKEGLPSGSFTSGGEDALPEGRASFGKLHLWRFPKEAEGRASSRKKGFLRLSERSFTSGGFPKEANLF